MASRKTEGWHGWDTYAPFYDWENKRTLGRRDVAFWVKTLAETRGPVLELGCGTGRLLAPIARSFANDSGPVDAAQGKGLRAFLAPRRRRRQLMALIITDKAEAVAKRVLIEIRRGMTALPGKGMYTGKEHSVLICAITVTEVNSLKAAVAKEDPDAFLVDPVGQAVRIVEFAGSYSAEHLQKFHEHCAGSAARRLARFLGPHCHSHLGQLYSPTGTAYELW